ncbi:MAG: hypothetical protein AN484_19850, partial [Aphanizomenon flos-aquae WA102]
MQDIGQLILGGSKPPPQQQSGDSFRFENLQPSQVQMAIKRFTDMGQNPQLLESVLASPDKFNAYPLDVRRQFFQLSSGSQPAMARPYGGEPVTAQAATQPTQPTMRQTAADSIGDMILGKPVEVQTTEPAARKVGKVKDMSQPGPLTQFGRSAASFYDATIGSVVPGIVEPVTYAGARAVGKTPEQAKEISTAAAAPFESSMGKTFGVTETPEYQGEAARRLTNFIGENFQKGAAWIAKETGLPATDIENMMGTLAVGGGVKVAPAVQRGILKGSETVETALGTNVPKAPETPRIEPTLGGKPKVTYADFQAQLQAKQQGGPAATLPPAPRIQTPTMPAPTQTQPFPEVKYAPKGKVNLGEQEQRKQIL